MMNLNSGHSKSDRPQREYETGPVTRVIRIAALILGAAVWIAVIVRFPAMPQTIPTHFDITGTADGWGPKGTIFLLMGIFTVLMVGLTWVSHHPRSFNYTVVITEGNAQLGYRRGEQMLVWLSASISLLFTGIVLGSLFTFNSGVLVVIGAIGLVTSVVAGLVLCVRASHGR